MRPGAMRHRVTIQRRASGVEAAGGVLNGWEDFATRSASIDRAPGSEVWAAAQKSGRVPVVFRLRYLAGVTPAMRLLHKGVVHEIKSAVDMEGRGAELVITAEELVEEAP
jgi:SPP1 family predicted phage head-tail adaptor